MPVAIRLLCALAFLSGPFCLSPAQRPVPSRTPLLLAHYMPWYANKEESGSWGWHWTMNHFNPDSSSGGIQEAASHYRPLIGLYDSSDPDVLEYHALLMKVAGFDGAAIDWYGIENYYDYATNNRNARLFINELNKVGLKYTLVYEDQTVAQEIKGNLFPASQAVEKGADAMQWLQNGWFKTGAYIHLNGRPVLLVFGPQYFRDQDWNVMFKPIDPPPAFFTLMFAKGPAVGAFAWPTPQRGEAASWDELSMFERRSKGWQAKIEVAYPRFDDIYREAGLSGFPAIEDRAGDTLRKTLDRALASNPYMVQVATWNDWGEGTQIEPSREFGYRDLEIVQSYRRKLSPGFAYKPADLRIPLQIFRARKSYKGNATINSKLDKAADDLAAGHAAKAATELVPFRA